jgi:hypothetical protein
MIDIISNHVEDVVRSVVVFVRVRTGDEIRDWGSVTGDRGGIWQGTVFSDSACMRDGWLNSYLLGAMCGQWRRGGQ